MAITALQYPAEFEEIGERAARADAVVIGPGLGANLETLIACRDFLLSLPETTPVLLDADGLKLLSVKSSLRKNIVITPHIGEFARLTGIDWREAGKSTFDLARLWAKKLGCTLLLKGTPTIISDGRISFFNTNGNPGMASAGSGDVLSGIIGALLARRLAPLHAAALGAFLHGEAGDIYAASYSQESLTASKLIHTLQDVFSKFSSHTHK